MPGGHANLCAVMGWHSRKVPGWAVSNTMETGLCDCCGGLLTLLREIKPIQLMRGPPSNPSPP